MLPAISLLLTVTDSPAMVATCGVRRRGKL